MVEEVTLDDRDGSFWILTPTHLLNHFYSADFNISSQGSLLTCALFCLSLQSTRNSGLDL